MSDRPEAQTEMNSIPEWDDKLLLIKWSRKKPLANYNKIDGKK